MLKYIDTIKELLVFYLIMLVTAASLFSWFEGKDFIDSLWWACVTAMTVGYGDMYPVTLGGKIVSVVLMHMSVLLILPLLIGHICTRCIDDRDQFTHEEQEEIKKMLKDIKNKLKD